MFLKTWLSEEADCGTVTGLIMTPVIEGGDIIAPLGERVLGRVVAQDVVNGEGETVMVAEAGP